MKDVVMNGYREKKNIQLYALIVNLPIWINLPERRNNFLLNFKSRRCNNTTEGKDI